MSDPDRANPRATTPAPTAPRRRSRAATGANPPQRPGRDRAATEERILGAVAVVLARDGFAALGVNAIAREAGVDKVLIYRYFGGLPELLTRWGASGRFWPRLDDLLAREPGLLQRPAAERWAAFFDHFIDELRARALTLEIMAAEVAHRNELTAILETERETWGQQATRVLGGPEMAGRPELGTLTLLLVAGVQHLLLRSRHIRVFGGLELREDATWAAVKRDLAQLAQRLFDAPAAPGAGDRPGPGARPGRAASKPPASKAKRAGS